MNNMRRGFTMIELIFVIVIIGILAAVAIPKLANTQKSAKASVVEAFVGTMNRSVFPAMYAKAIRTDGLVSGYDIKDYVDVPTEIGTVTLSNCQATTFASATAAATSNLGIALYCRDGNATHPPVMGYDNVLVDGNQTMPDTWFD